MKKCKHCGETDIDKLLTRKFPRGVRVYNTCNSCYSKNMSKGQKGKKISIEGRRNMSVGQKGRKHSKEIGQKKSKTLTGRKMPDEQKKALSDALMGRKIPQNIRINMRLGRIKYIEQNQCNGLPLHPCIGKNETKILDEIEKRANITITRQYKVIGYFLDGYDKENNVAYEIDENYHFTDEQIEKDSIREENIVKELGCGFIRVPDI